MTVTSHKTDKFMQEYWDLNKKYPEFQTCVEFDHASSPSHNIEECKKLFTVMVEEKLHKSLKNIALQIGMAEEQDNEVLRKQLIVKRKELRTLYNLDLSKVQTVDDLVNLKPEGI